jgi:SAM-dependent methyltransferase
MTRCLCGGTASSPFLTVGGMCLVRCRACRLVYTSDFRSAATLYAGDAYYAGRGGYIDRQDTFRTLFERLTDKIRRFKPCGTLLDVGTGVGILLEVASGKGFDVTGVEVSEWASAYARDEKGLEVVPGSLEDAHFADTSFDVVVLNHVLEHVETPKSLLAEIRRILKDDGILAIGVPNAGSLMAAILGTRWASWRPEQHRWHFTPGTLGNLVRSAGFDVMYREMKENGLVTERGAKGMAQRFLNGISSMANRAESMLFIARKSGEGPR